EKYPDSLKYAFIKAGEVERGRFMRLDSMRYKVDVSLGTLNILNLRPDRYYAVGYRIEGESPDRRDDQYYGNFSQDAKPKDTLILKLIYRPNMQPGFVTLWERQMKNIYSINATNVNIDGTKIGIWYFNQNNDSSDVLQGAPDKLVTIMGVDQVNNSTGSAPPDGQFDLRPPFFDMQTGEIIFPSLKPFEDGLYDYFNSKGTPQLADQYMFPDIYDTTYDVARQNTARDRFVVSGEVSGRSTNRIALGAFNLAPGSVKVTLDGVPLREFEDYVVDYYSGQLTLRNPRASLPNANLRIEYEANDIFNISTRTLAGIRGDFQLYKTRKINTQIGFTIMHYDQSAIIDRVRLGEEPVSNTMLGLDAKLDWDIPWMTKMLDMLPFYDTKVQSSLQMRGEAAMTLPEPNKRRSEVASDNNEPVVYIDDFEGAQRYISLGLTASQWSHSSQPVDSLIAPNDSARALFRGKTFWYQRFIPYVEIKDIYPNKDIVQGRTKISPINIVFEPDIRGIYNKNEKFLDTLNPEYNSSSAFSKDPQNRQKIWGGIMRLFSSFNTNFDTENIDYIEIMMNISDKEVGTKMYVDLGQISEDIIPNQRLDTEDGITKDNPIPNNMIDKGEDVGIDALSDAREKDTYLYPLNLEKDPARDNYSFNFDKDDNDRSDKDFVDYNNYENNSLISEIGQFPDTEILNRNNGQTISLDNSYFTYEVELIKDPQRPEENPQIVGGNKDKQWFLYRIPIRKPVSKTGNPLFSNIQYIRVWFKGGRMNAHIADWRLVGSQWQRINNFQSNVSKDDSVLQVAFVNREENNGPPDYYSMPPGVKAPRQLSNPNPNEDIRLNEQSMAISAKNLRYGDERMAVRIFRPLDVFYYKRLKFFVHGDGSMPDNIVASAVPKAVAFLRFGIDSMNYYEYRIPIKRGWQSIDIELARLTAIKQLREQLGDTINPYVRRLFPVYPGSVDTFAIRGNPVLTKVQFFGFGITNPPERYPNELTTTMWVDELRLLSPEDRSDWAGIGSVNLKLADLGTINATISHTKPNFHKLEERFGDRINTTNWTVSMQGNLERFAPQSFREMKIPITYTHSEFVQDPEYVANSDINLSKAASASRLNAYDSTYNSAIITLPEEQARKIAQTIGDSAYGATIERSQTLKVLDSWALTGVRLGIPVRHWLVTETFNRITVGYSYSQEYERSPVVSQRFSWLWQLTTQYSLPLKELVTAKPFSWAVDVPVFGTYKDMKINFLPSNISASLNMNRSRTTEQSRFLPYPSPVFRNFSAQQQAQFSWKLSENGLLSPIIDYNVTSVSTLVPYELDENNRQRTGSELASKILFNNGLIDLGKTNNQIQNVTINFRPRLPIDFLTRYSDMTGSFNTTYTWLNPLQPDPKIHDIAKSASWNNVIRFNFGFRLKALGDSWFGSTDPKLIRKDPPDSTKKTGVLNSIGRIFKTIFFDYDKLDISLNQNSSSVNPGVLGGTGFSNFWGRGMLGRESMNLQGPSFAYQLGLINQPHGGFKMVSSDKFPFFGFDTYPGLRPPNAILPENYSQKTSLELRTSRPLWEGATLDLTWGTDLAYNKNQIVETDEFGRPRFTNIIATESFNRTYLSMPSFLGLNIFNNTVEHVIDLYNTEEKKILKGKNRDEATVEENKKMLAALSTAFHDGLQSFSLFSGSAGKFLPAVNWGIRWEGLQKWDFWKDYVKTASIEHAYTSKYTESAQITNTGRATQNQMVQMGFQPLVGLTVGFDEAKLKGNLTATLRYATSTGYNLNSANRATISRQSTDEFQLQASYTMRGFTFELIGLKLQNDLEFSFLASYKKNKRATYDILNLEEKGNTDGRTLDGNTKITIEPRARYSMSNRVTASFFVRYEGTFTEGAAQPGFNTTQVGLDIRIAIAGGR
ncbi:MAG: hypothetical protein QG635_1, partial [Bacteroidota bacterium]|nr:hypothetical protein [Bacteroidota bacterium]